MENVRAMSAKHLTLDMILFHLNKDREAGELKADKIVILCKREDGTWEVRSNTTVEETATAALRLNSLATDCVLSPVYYE